MEKAAAAAEKAAALQLPVPSAQAFGGSTGNRAAELPDSTSDHGDPGAELEDGRIGVPDADEGGEEKQRFVDLPQNATSFSGADSVSC
jgi:hypothetical protein